MDPTEIYIDVSLAAYDFNVSMDSPTIPTSLSPDQSLDVSAAIFEIPVS